jgi:hypothetical protein
MHKFNVAIVDCSYMFRLHTAVFIRLNTTNIRKEIILHIVIGRDLGLTNVIYSEFGKSLCTYKRCSSIERTTVSKTLIKQLHALPVLHFNRRLTTEYNETTAHFNGNFDTDNQVYVP